MSAFSVDRIDHLVLTVKDLQRTVSFYSSVLGFEPRTFRDGRTALHFGDQKINLHEVNSPMELTAQLPAPGTADLCFIATTSIDAVRDHLGSNGIPIIEGPIRRTGALGEMTSVYFREPDQNLIEVAVYD